VTQFNQNWSVSAQKGGHPRDLKVAAHRDIQATLMKNGDITVYELQSGLLE
jgi:hypothetical protein